MPDLNVIVTDTDASLIRTILEEFPLASHLLCLWHINRNVMANCKKLFEDEEEFYREWHQVVYSHTKQEFTERYNAIKQKYEDHLGFPAYII